MQIIDLTEFLSLFQLFRLTQLFFFFFFFYFFLNLFYSIFSALKLNPVHSNQAYLLQVFAAFSVPPFLSVHERLHKLLFPVLQAVCQERLTLLLHSLSL